MRRQFAALVDSVHRALLGYIKYDRTIGKLYEQKPYLDAYSEHTDQRVADDPRQAVGGMWEEIGHLQFDFTRGAGLLPSHRMLDIGCGTLRGGRHFIRYLDPGHYTGMDISAKAIEFGRELVAREGLTDKAPTLVVSVNKNLRFAEFTGQTFEYLLAQSVFTHLLPEHIEECFAHVGQVMHDGSQFCFTYSEGAQSQPNGLKDFRYPLSYFEKLSAVHGFHLRDRSADYPHPRRQRMLVVTKASIADRTGGRVGSSEE